jgi:3-oxoacyl-[acyl-carrier protein] reductase
MDLKLSGHSVLVTGGSRGIGRAIALGFAGEGALVAICGRDRAQLEVTKVEIEALGTRCHAISADLARADECRRVVDETAERFGRLDSLINNASVSVDKASSSLEDTTDAQLLERIEGKAMVAIRCSRAALAHMRKAGGGRIVMIGGVSARTVIRGDEAMSIGSVLPQGIGNAALANFTKFLSEDVAKDNIAVNIVHPYFTHTGRFPGRRTQYARAHGLTETEAEAKLISQMPIGRFVYPSDIAPLVVLLGSPLVGAITGQSVAVDGGAARAVAY